MGIFIKALQSEAPSGITLNLRFRAWGSYEFKAFDLKGTG
jgi:hypothetical protein